MSDQKLVARRQHRNEGQLAIEQRLEGVEGRLTSVVAALHGLVVNHVLDSETAQLDATGILEKSWTVPFGSISVINTSAANITVVAGTRSTDTAPKVGKGVVVVPSGGSVVVPITGRAVTFYGAAGASFFFALFTTLMPPEAGSSGVTGTPAGVADNGTVAAPAGAVTQIAPATARKSITIINSGTVPVKITYDGTGTKAGFPLAVGLTVTLNSTSAVFVNNTGASAGQVDWISD